MNISAFLCRIFFILVQQTFLVYYHYSILGFVLMSLILFVYLLDTPWNEIIKNFKLFSFRGSPFQISDLVAAWSKYLFYQNMISFVSFRIYLCLLVKINLFTYVEQINILIWTYLALWARFYNFLVRKEYLIAMEPLFLGLLGGL